MLDLSISNFSASLFQDATEVLYNTLQLTNKDTEPIDWFIADADEETLLLPEWLEIGQGEGRLEPGQSQTVELTFSSLDLLAGTYFYEFEVVSMSGHRSPPVSVSLTIVGPVLQISAEKLVFYAEEGNGSPPDQTFTIENNGGGTLNWSMDLSDKPSWLTILPVEGELRHDEVDAVALSLDTSDLPRGLYTYALIIEDGAGENEPYVLTVELIVHGWLYADDDAPNDPGSGNPFISDPLEDGSTDHPFDTIQEAIDSVVQKDIITVSPGMYFEDVHIGGKDVILTSVEPLQESVVQGTVICGGVSFSGNESPACMMRGFTITGSVSHGINGGGAHASVDRCFVTANALNGLYNVDGTITNCIVCNNSGTGLI